MSQKVPPYPLRNGRTREQKEFCKLWLAAWQNKEPIDIENQFGYLFYYVHSLIPKLKTEADLERLESEVIALQKAYPYTNWKECGSFHYFALTYRADSLIFRKNYQKAIETLSEAYNLSFSADICKILSLKSYIGGDVEGRDLLFLGGVPSLTAWGRENWELLIKAANEMLDEKRKALGSAILPTWVKWAKWYALKWDDNPEKTCQLFSEFNHPNGRFATSIPYYNVYPTSPFSLPAYKIPRYIENIARENRGLPKVGEGWISETELYHAIKDAFPKLEVINHAIPKWLGRQHLDVYIPEKKIALEFQGEQHDKPIRFFGGDEAFIATQERDARKASLCEKHGVKLIYVRTGYPLEDILQEIKGWANSSEQTERPQSTKGIKNIITQTIKKVV
jgi:hypothetical protein